MIEKKYFSIGDVSRITNVKPYILRYWENEFNLVRPIRLSNGKRRYTQEDVNTVIIVRELVYDKKYSVAGAKRELSRIKNNKDDTLFKNIEESIKTNSSKELFKDIADELGEIIKLL